MYNNLSYLNYPRMSFKDKGRCMYISFDKFHLKFSNVNSIITILSFYFSYESIINPQNWPKNNCSDYTNYEAINPRIICKENANSSD